MQRRTPLILVLVAFLAFVSLGLPDGTLGVAWPSLSASFGIPVSRLGVLLAAATIGYLGASFQAASLLNRFGIGWLLIASTGLTAFASIGYALAGLWPILVLLTIVLGLGAGAIDTGTNAFAASNF